MSTLKKFTDWRQWFRALAKTSIHAGTGAILATVGTNAAAVAVPSMADIAMNGKQALAVFTVSAALAAIRFINATTDEDSQ